MCSHQSEKASKGTGFLSPRSSKITVTKEKARKGERQRARRRKGGEKAIVALLVIIMTTFGRKKICWTQKIHLAIIFSVIQLDIFRTYKAPRGTPI